MRFALADSRTRLLIFAALVVLIIFPGLRSRGLPGYDDALYAHEAKYMVHTGEWWNVRFNGEQNYEYLPMFMWLDALSMRIFGINDFAAKLPSALAGFGAILALLSLARRLSGDETLAFLSAFILATTQPFLKYSGHAMTDVPFTFFCVLGLLCYVSGLGGSDDENASTMKSSRWFWFMAAGVAFSAAILTRSVLGLAPLGVVFLDFALRGDWRRLLSIECVAGAAIALLPAVLWIAWQHHIHGQDFLRGHFGFVSEKIGGTPPQPGRFIPFATFAVYLAKYYWPWLPVMLTGAVLAAREMPAVIHPSCDAGRKSAYLKPSVSRASVFALLWAVVVIAPMGFASTQYGRYVVPALPACAILSATALRKWIPQRYEPRLFAWAVPALLAVALIAGLLPVRKRAVEMRAMAAAAEAQTAPSERILLYTYGYFAWDLRNEFVWYADRRIEHLTDLVQLANRFKAAAPAASGNPAVRRVAAVIDRRSYRELEKRLAADNIHPLLAGESKDFVLARYP